jgi:hypothetical protein
LELAYYDLAAAISASPGGQQLLRLADVLNAKSSSLLTHISIMIAVVAYYTSAAKCEQCGTLEKVIAALLYSELIAYVTIGLVCLRSISITAPKSFLKSIEKKNNEEALCLLVMIVRRRRNYYLASLWATAIITVIFISTIGLKLIEY